MKLDQNEGAEGLKLMDEALELYRQVGDRVGQANIFWNLGMRLVNNNNLAEAEPLVAQAVELARQILNPDHPILEGWESVLEQVRAELEKEDDPLP